MISTMWYESCDMDHMIWTISHWLYETRLFHAGWDHGPCDMVSTQCSWSCSHKLWSLKSSPYPSHFIFEINVGERRIRHRKTLNFEWPHLQSIMEDHLIQIRRRSLSEVPPSRNRLLPTLISKIKWLVSELPLICDYLSNYVHFENKLFSDEDSTIYHLFHQT